MPEYDFYEQDLELLEKYPNLKIIEMWEGNTLNATDLNAVTGDIVCGFCRGNVNHVIKAFIKEP